MILDTHSSGHRRKNVLKDMQRREKDLQGTNPRHHDITVGLTKVAPPTMRREVQPPLRPRPMDTKLAYHSNIASQASSSIQGRVDWSSK